jgi:vacuolar protein sorting-associated protein 52
MTPRSSSLSLVSNDSSTSSLLASSRRAANGSSLKQTTTTTPSQDPVEILNQILGEDAGDSGSQHAKTITGEDLELEFDFGGLSLTDLAFSEDPASVERANVHRSQTVEECMCLPVVFLLPILSTSPSLPHDQFLVPCRKAYLPLL